MKCPICSEEIADGQAKLTTGGQDYHEACLAFGETATADKDSASTNSSEPDDSDEATLTANR